MSVFKIQQHSIQPIVDKQASMEEAASIEGEASPEVETEVVTTSVEKSGVDVSKVEGATVAAETEEAKVSQDPKMMVKIDGPIGRVYTEALNKMLALEGFAAMVPHDFNVDKSVEDAVDEGDVVPVMQLYCWSGNEINTQDIVQITNDIVRSRHTDYVIAVEMAGVVRREMMLLDQLGRLPNVKICYSRSAALDVMRGKLIS